MRTINPVFIMGAGSVGLGLAHALTDASVELRGIWSRSERNLESLPESVPFFSGWEAPGLEAALRTSPTVILAVSDGAIASCSAQLLERKLIGPNTTIAHTAGCTPIQVITAAAGIYRGGMHPLAAIPNAEIGRTRLRTCVYGIEADGPAHDQLQALVNELGGKAFSLDTGQRSRYHAAAVMASNLVVGLMDFAIEEAQRAGLSEPTAPLVELAIGALRSVRESGTHQALTGPVVRGDIETVSAHLETLDNPAQATYQLLSARLVEMARSRGVDAARITELENLLR